MTSACVSSTEARWAASAITVGALPAVLPINFRLVDDRIVFRTSGGAKLDAATRNAVVAFEVDDMEPLSHTGWSVMVTGMAREVTDPAEARRVAIGQHPSVGTGRRRAVRRDRHRHDLGPPHRLGSLAHLRRAR